jgi:hypothetical protein
MPQVNSFQTFKFTGTQGTSPPVNVPLTPNNMIVVILQSSSPSVNTSPTPASSVLDTMSNQYQRIRSSSTQKSSAGQFITAFTEIWVAQCPFAIPSAATVTVNYSSNSVVLANVIVLSTITNNYYLGIDSAASTNGGQPNLVTASSVARTVNAGIGYNTTGNNELILSALTYLIEVGSPSVPTITPGGVSSILSNIDNPYVAVGDGAVQSGLTVLTANAASPGTTPISANIALIGGQSLVTFFESIAIIEGPYPSTSVPQFIIPSSSGVSGASRVAQVATLTPPTNVIQLPLGQ